MNSYKLIALGFEIFGSTDDQIFLAKTYKNGAFIMVRCDVITTHIEKVKRIC